MRFARLGACAFLLSGMLSACGFTPLYGEHADSASPGVVDEFSRVAIRPIPDRQGQRLSQILREELQPSGRNGPSRYDLDVTLTSRVEELGIRKDATSSRANFILAASFYLSSGGQRLFGDRVQTIVGYNILDDQYATVAAQGDAQERAIEEAGREIKTRLAVFFKKRAAQAASAH
jgi:LPS-assembly lipoprotein